jgi:hypothetical protein
MLCQQCPDVFEAVLPNRSLWCAKIPSVLARHGNAELSSLVAGHPGFAVFETWHFTLPDCRQFCGGKSTPLQQNSMSLKHERQLTVIVRKRYNEAGVLRLSIGLH